MSAQSLVTALGRLDGVREATLCASDGRVLESTAITPVLPQAARGLAPALAVIQQSVPTLDGGLALTVDSSDGYLHCTQTALGLLMVLAEASANHGAIRLEMRTIARALDA